MAGLSADPRDDVYALGVIWHQLLTGDMTQGAPRGSKWKERLAEKGVPATMVRLLEDCFEDDPEDRPKDAADLAVRLSGLLTPATTTSAIPGSKQQEGAPPLKEPVLPSATHTKDQGGDIQHLGQGVLNRLEQRQIRRREQDGPLEQKAPLAVSPPGKGHIADPRHPSESREKVKGTLEAKEVLKLGEQGAEEGFGHFGRFATAIFSPDGRFILSACQSVLLWDFPGGKVIGELKLPPQTASAMIQPVAGLAFSLDGRQALTGGMDAILRLWDLSSLKEIRSFGGGWFQKNSSINSVAFGPEGRFALVGGADPYMRMWDVASNKLVRKFEEGVVNTGLSGLMPGMDFQMATVLKGVAFSPDGRHAVSAGDAVRRASGRYVAVLWDVQTGQRLRPFEGHEGFINSIGFSPDGRHVLSGSEDKTMRLWDTTSGKEIQRFDGHPAPVHAVAFSPDGRLAVSGNGLFAAKTPEQRPPESTVRVWKVESGEEVCQLAGHTGQVRSVSFSPNGQFVLTAGSDKTIRVWAIRGV